jgi:cell division protein YceG involved in septum cleavage
MSSMQIAAVLKGQGIIRSRYVFLALHEVKGGTLKAGEYRFDHPAPMSEVWDRIRRGDVDTVALTIPEGSNVFDIAGAGGGGGAGIEGGVYCGRAAGCRADQRSGSGSAEP